MTRLSGRWIPGTPDPEEFIPGDVVPIREMALCKLPVAIAATRAQPDRSPPGDFERFIVCDYESLLVDMTSALPFFIPSTSARPVLQSRPPPPALLADLRLPARRVYVLFGADQELSGDDYPWPDVLRDAAMQKLADPAPDDHLARLICGGGFVSGMVLLADRGWSRKPTA